MHNNQRKVKANCRVGRQIEVDTTEHVNFNEDYMKPIITIDNYKDHLFEICKPKGI